MNIKRFRMGLAAFLSFNIYGSLAYAAVAPELTHVFVETGEHDSFYGDSIRLIFSAPMSSGDSSDSRVEHTEDTDSPRAPAGYAGNNSASARNAAKNYLVTITPDRGSRTKPYTGTWKQLGGKAVYDKYDPTRSTVLLLPPHRKHNIFKPGDSVEVTIASTIQDHKGKKLNPNKRKKKQRSS